MFGLVRKMSNRWKFGQIAIGLSVILTSTAVSHMNAEIVEYKITDSYGNKDVMAVSKDRAEIETYVNNHPKGGMVFTDKDTGEYQFIPHTISLKGLLYWYE